MKTTLVTSRQKYVTPFCSVILGLALAGCGDSTDDRTPVEANDLGITHLRVDHLERGDDRILEIVGFDDSGDEVATATLRTGMVLYGADMPEAWHPGTELTIAVGEHNASYVSPDREPHSLGAPERAPLDAFIRLAPVSRAIEQNAGIRFEPRATGEIAFAATVCSGANFPTANGSPSQCCMDGANIYHKIASGTNLNKLAWRETGTTCRTSSGTTGCTTDCYYGPCGARIVGVSGTNTTAAAVFTPTSASTQCGRDSNGSSAGGGMEAPEAYTGAQALKSGVTASCKWTECLADGRPGPGFWLTIEAYCHASSATGTVCLGGSPYCVSCSGDNDSQSSSFWIWDAGTKQVNRSPNGWWNSCPGGSGTASCSGAWTTDTVVSAGFGASGGGGGGLEP